MKLTYTLRPERPDDYREAESLTREAFWDLMGPGCDEHYLLHVMRGDSSFVPELGYVAEKDGKIIGHIAYALSHIEDQSGNLHEVLTFGPVSVLPGYQKQGVGARLIRHTLKLARGMGHTAVVIFGHPEYYPRFGFRRARDFGLTASNGEAPDAFMALELAPGSLSGFGCGVFREADVYHVDHDAALAFDKSFPPKEKKADARR
jgi:predicted N-acetyltransferase YhbS